MRGLPAGTAAVAYARRGIPVLPLHTPDRAGRCSCGRADCDRAGKHPRLRHGLIDASTDEPTVAFWWTVWPDANIGLRTGVVMDVVDVDDPDGARALTTLTRGLPPVPLVRTGSGGWHLWLRPTGLGNRTAVLPGVDFRGRGGYVVAPPSRHVSGEPYRWLRDPDTPLTSCPRTLYRLLRPPPPRPPAPAGRIRHPDGYARAALAAEADRVAGARVGQRNDTLNRAAYALGRLVAAGLLDERTVRRALTTAARRAGLGRAETDRTLRSGLTAGSITGPRAPS